MEKYPSVTSDENITAILIDIDRVLSQTIKLENVDLSNELRQGQSPVINTSFISLGKQTLLDLGKVNDDTTLIDEDINDLWKVCYIIN